MKRDTTVASGDAGSARGWRDGSSPNRHDEIDETLIDLMLEQSITDRLQSLSNYVTALARFRRV